MFEARLLPQSPDSMRWQLELCREKAVSECQNPTFDIQWCVRDE